MVTFEIAKAQVAMLMAIVGNTQDQNQPEKAQRAGQRRDLDLRRNRGSLYP